MEKRRLILPALTPERNVLFGTSFSLLPQGNLYYSAFPGRFAHQESLIKSRGAKAGSLSDVIGYRLRHSIDHLLALAFNHDSDQRLCP